MIKLDLAHNKFVDHLRDRGRSEATVIAYKKDIEQLVDHLFKKGVNQVNEIDLEHLQDFMDKLAAKEYTPKSISRKTNSTKTFFRYLMAEGHITSNAADDLKHPKVEIKAPRILSRQEYGALRDVARDDSRTYAIIEVLLQTGVRISELSQIKVEDVEIKGKTGVLHVPDRPGHPARDIPLNKSAVQAIKDYLKDRYDLDSEYLFITKTGRPMLVRNIRATIDRYFKNAGIHDAKVNDMRHTFVAHHLTHGTRITRVSKVAGHKRLSTTERYLEYIAREVEEEREDLTDL
jgi:site-specific recombinase XerD